MLVDLGVGVSIDELVDRVWGEAPPQRARLTLHTYLSRLRGVLADADGPALVRRSRGYTLDADPAAVDLHRFRVIAGEARSLGDDDRATALWRDALALWRGTPFADLDSDWLRQVAAALEAERFETVLDRNDALLRRGEYAPLLPELSAAAAEHPLDERVAGQLMLAMYGCGRQAEALAHYRALHDRLVDEVGCDPGPVLRLLHQRILRQDPELAPTVAVRADQHGDPPAAADRTGTGAAANPAAQLPADVVGFTGRTASLHQLDALLGPADDPPSTVLITAIGGYAGVGKTALAVHWAHRVRDRFPDGQVYLNLRGFDPGGQVVSPAEALRTLLELLRVPPDRIPTSTQAQAGLYRDRVAGRRMLVVLDNARDAAQVRPLLPGSAGSMVVVTSRDQLAGLVAADGARPVRLDVLDEAESRQLLVGRLGAERVTAEPEAVDRIVQACAGLPLALAMVAARAATNPGFRLAAFAGELADMQGRLDALASHDVATDVRAVFSWSYEALTPPAARLFRQLGLHPGPDLGTAAAASLAGLPVPAVRRTLAELTAAHLLTEHAPGRYAFHDLLRAYAAELGRATDTEPERRAARHRMLDHYLHSVHAADRWLPDIRDKVTPPPAQDGVATATFAGNTEARAWLTTELPVLLAVVDQHRDGDFDHHIQQLCWLLVTFLGWLGRWPDLVTVQRAALEATRRRGDVLGQADIHRNLAHASFQMGLRDEADAHLEQALRLYREAGENTSHIRAQLYRAWLAGQEGLYADALRIAQLSLEAATEAGHRVLQAVARTAVGWYHTVLGDHEQAIVDCEQALVELAEVNELSNMADVWDSLGHAHLKLGRYREAIDYYQRAVERCREFGNRHMEALKLIHLGEAHQAAGDDEATRTSWRQALAILDEVGHRDADDLRSRLGSLRLGSLRLGSLHEGMAGPRRH
ncbi:AfsR/SARP family transcriptional regulator [Phytohabitans kaempferiae]|uniref:AfsR/SARP family transcriptional regulator n=1 Tax=Phytohabitans kaempferiae TaxID=1620943 RepID=UPI00366B8870